MVRTQLLTIQQLINQHKIILYRLLIKLAKVALAQCNQPIEKLKHKRRICITFCNSNNVDILVLDMTECGAPECENGGPHLRVRYDLNPEDV